MKAKKKSSYDASEKFLEYQQFIVSHPAYAGMPDLYCEDGSIQWEAPSNRQSGQFKDTHDKRLLWWKKKAEEVGISVSENEWRSKVAKKIHPTQMHPCKKCGRLMDIRYLYLNGGAAAATYTETLLYGEEYRVQSPVVAGFHTADQLVSGTMPDRNVTITVIYIANGQAINTITIEDFETPLGVGLGGVNTGETIE